MDNIERTNKQLFFEYLSTIDTQLISKGIFIFQTKFDEDDINFQLDCSKFETEILMEVLLFADEIMIKYHNDRESNKNYIIELLIVLENMIESTIPWSVNSNILLETKRLGIKLFDKELGNYNLEDFYKNNKFLNKY